MKTAEIIEFSDHLIPGCVYLKLPFEYLGFKKWNITYEKDTDLIFLGIYICHAENNYKISKIPL